MLPLGEQLEQFVMCCFQSQLGRTLRPCLMLRHQHYISAILCLLHMHKFRQCNVLDDRLALEMREDDDAYQVTEKQVVIFDSWHWTWVPLYLSASASTSVTSFPSSVCRLTSSMVNCRPFCIFLVVFAFLSLFIFLNVPSWNVDTSSFVFARVPLKLGSVTMRFFVCGANLMKWSAAFNHS